MKTSYFSKSSNHPNAVSIASKCPHWYNGKEYKNLAPKYWFLKKYKEDGDQRYYTKQYKKILSKLNAQEVYNELGEDAVLLCWESPKEFCHRKLVAKWFEEEIGIKVNEL